MTPKHPIPDDALDDRLGFVGTAGSGKTYNAGSAVERILGRDGRVLIPDPLGVWWGLRLSANGSHPSPWNVVIFGGPHGDLPLNEHAGALIGETCAGMAESAIIDLSEIGTKAAERRFMLAFLAALYRKTAGEPVHVVFDEADMWAPQRLLDKEGEAAKLQGMMETIVRRGRIKGFIPWLITQRPAVLSKDVLSQVDGLLSFKLTSSQDRDAIGAWVEGQADQGEWRRIRAGMATLPRGTGIVWLPTRGILDTAAFPPKVTYDSSRTPKRGETVHHADLPPLDLPALKERMAKVETEAKANDPKALRTRIAELERTASKGVDPAAVDTARREGYERGFTAGAQQQAAGGNARILELRRAIDAAAGYLVPFAGRKTDDPDEIPVIDVSRTTAPPVIEYRQQTVRRQIAGSGESMPGPHRKLLTVLAQYPQGRTKKQLAILAGYAHNGGAFNNPLANLRSRGWAEGGPDCIRITEAGLAALGDYDPLPSGAALREYWFGNLAGPAAKLLRALCDAYPRGLSKTDLAAATGYEPSGGAFNNPLARLRSLELATGKGGAEIRASDDLFE